MRPRILSISPARELVVDEVITRPLPPANPLPLLSSHSEGLVPVYAGNEIKGGDDIGIPVADTFGGAGPAATKAPLGDIKNDDARQTLVPQEFSKPIPVAEIDRAGRVAGGGASGCVVVASVGNTAPATHAGTNRGGRGGGGLAVIGEDKGPSVHADNAGGVGLSSEQEDAKSNAQSGVGGSGAGVDAPVGNGPREYAGGSANLAVGATTFTATISTAERSEVNSANDRGSVEIVLSDGEESSPAFDETRGSSLSVCGELARAVGEAALEIARDSHIAGVSQAAEAVSVLVKLFTDDRDNRTSNEASLRRCRSIVVMLKQAEKVLGKVRWRSAIWGHAARLYRVSSFLLRSSQSVVMFPLQVWSPR